MTTILKIADIDTGKVFVAAVFPWVVDAKEWIGLLTALGALVYVWAKVYYLHKNKGGKDE